MAKTSLRSVARTGRAAPDSHGPKYRTRGRALYPAGSMGRDIVGSTRYGCCGSQMRHGRWPAARASCTDSKPSPISRARGQDCACTIMGTPKPFLDTRNGRSVRPRAEALSCTCIVLRCTRCPLDPALQGFPPETNAQAMARGIRIEAWRLAVAPGRVHGLRPRVVTVSCVDAAAGDQSKRLLP